MYNADSIIYNGKNSEEYGLAIAYMDTPTVDTGLARETTKNEYNVRRRKLNYYGAKFTNGIALEITFIKNPCSGKDEDNFFTLEESTAINEWLTEPETPTTLLVNNDETMQLAYNAIVTNVEDTIIRGRVAKTVTFETDSPFSKQRPIQITIDESQGNKSIKNKSGAIAYPVLKIIPKTSSDIVCSLTNISDNNQTIDFNLDNFPNGIIVNCDRMRITEVGDTDQIPILISDVIEIDEQEQEQELYWFRLLRGENIVNTTGNCDVTITYSPERRTGSV